MLHNYDHCVFVQDYIKCIQITIVITYYSVSVVQTKDIYN